MGDREPGAALIVYRGDTSTAVLVADARSWPPRLDPSEKAPRPRDRRRPGRLPDRLLRGLVLDRLV
ncbi:MAG: hypothetical protein KatS3mg117_0486 [Geminicoccaceae bacterium]|jgi:hypothetical protein|nr:MAG: hypothetical protein KatS3mg117_0486 [Geminicoccaceae bacterium]